MRLMRENEHWPFLGMHRMLCDQISGVFSSLIFMIIELSGAAVTKDCEVYFLLVLLRD